MEFGFLIIVIITVIVIIIITIIIINIIIITIIIFFFFIYLFIYLFMAEFLKPAGLAKIRTHSTTWQLKTIKFVQRPIKSLYLTPGSKLMVPRSIPKSRSLK